MLAFISFLLLLLFWVSIFQSSINAATKCTHGGAPHIRYPFHIKGHHFHYQTPPDFELLCKHNLTIIHFASYGNLIVKSITYDLKKIDLVDPKYCAHRVFLNLDLSLTPFHYYYVVKNYTYLNCSNSFSPGLMEIPCLSGPNHHIYTVDPSFSVPDSCEPIKTVAVPYEYSSYLSGNSLGLGLTWDLRDTQTPKQSRDSHIMARDTVVSMGILCIFAIATVMMVKIHLKRRARNWDEKAGHLLQSLADL
ncbi:RING-H2 finger protein ATL22 [Senna tora]|uniref:RING-type E3 ubiquitin transferase n=1 Tax=Senna tora TaxID=362788 RepID=A0A834WM52_9FABA|nr:RING-H2 finger protein ATL22 [Senna tora]